MLLIPNSLNRLLDIPQRKIDTTVGALPLEGMSNGLKAYEGSEPGLVYPGVEAFTFYTLNHLVSRIQEHYHPDEPLPEWAASIVNHYQETLVGQSIRLAFYLLMTTTREARHQHNMGDSYVLDHAAKFSADDHKKLIAFAKAIKGSGEESAVDRLRTSPPSVTCKSYIEHLSFVFHRGDFSDGYGGHPWGNIADCLLGVVNGTYSMEVMVDLGYALAHNNGPVFNKGMLYHHYGGSFLQLLDLQRAGMLTAFVLTEEKRPFHQQYSEQLMVEVRTLQKNIGGLPDKFDGAKIHQYAISNNKHYWANFFGLKDTVTYSKHKSNVFTIHPAYSIKTHEAKR